jgi:acyl-CoA synthetase (AMP-forming)/AMP-acid ligase II
MYITQTLHRSLGHTPDEPATIFGDRVRTVAEQADRVSRLAGGLRSLGLSNGERVAILSLNSDRYLETLLAICWADGIFNPVNIRWNPTEIAYSLRDSESTILVVDDAFAPMVPDLLAGRSRLRSVIHAGDGPAPEGARSYEDLVASAAPIPDARRGGEAVAGILYTGGTTGHPKGVALTHANLLTSVLGALATAPLARAGGRLLHAAPMFHMAGLHSWLNLSVVGGTHVAVPKFDPLAVMAAIQEHRVTSTMLVPTMIQAVVDHPDRDAYDLTSIETILYGASPITEAVLGRAIAALPHADFVQVYGMTELGTITVLDCDDHRRGDRPGSAGRAAVHAEVRIVDVEGEEVPRGTVGEVAVRGGHVMSGYWGKPKETAATLRDGWLHTGDGAYMDDEGYVFIVDRIKDMIITGGENVYSIDVEDALGRHPAVAACAVIGVPDDTWGERVHAMVVLAPSAEVTLDELQQHTRSLVAGYKVPRSIEFVDTLPLSGAGKVLKRELRARYETAGP